MRKDYIWNSIGSFLQSAISPVLLIIITRMNGIEDSGLFSFAMSISIIFWAIALWGGRTYQVSDIKKEFSTGGYITVRLITAVIVTVASVLFCLINDYTLTKTTLILILVLFKLIESLADVLYGILQINNKLYIAGFSLFIKAVGGAVLFTFINAITHNVIYSSLSLLLINVAVIILYDMPRIRKLQTSSKKTTRKISFYINEALVIMKRTAPVFIVIFLTMFSLNIPRYFLDKYHQDEIGYFGVMAMPITLLALFISFIIQPNIVGLSKLLAQKNIKQFDAMVAKMVVIALGIGTVTLSATWFAGVWAINWVFAITINEFEVELIIMVIGAISGAITSIYINILIIMRAFKWQFYALLLTTVLLVFLSPFLIEHYAMFGGVCLFMAINTAQAITIGLIYKNKINK